MCVKASRRFRSEGHEGQEGQEGHRRGRKRRRMPPRVLHADDAVHAVRIQRMYGRVNPFDPTTWPEHHDGGARWSRARCRMWCAYRPSFFLSMFPLESTRQTELS